MNQPASNIYPSYVPANDENIPLIAMDSVQPPNNIMDLLAIYHMGEELSAHALYDALAAGVPSSEFR